MTYTRDIPVSGDSLGGTRDRIRTNMQVIFDKFAVNHNDFNAAGSGKHKFLQMPEQGSPPTTDINEAGFYAKQGTNPSEANLFFRGEDDGFEYQLTRAISASTASFSLNVPLPSANGNGGWSFLPGGLILQYGAFNPNTSTTVEFPIAFSGIPFSVQLTPEPANNSTYRTGVANGSLTTSQFVFEGTVHPNLPTVFFIAIGR